MAHLFRFAIKWIPLIVISVFLINTSNTQSSHNTTPNLKVAFIADSAVGRNAHRVLELIKREGAELVIHSGDLGYGYGEKKWRRMVNSILGPHYPYLYSIGNHDIDEWPRYEAGLLKRIESIPAITCHGNLGMKSSCDYKGLLIVLSGAGTLGNKHKEYIKHALANTDAIWRIVSWHKNQRKMQIGHKINEIGWGAYQAARKGGAIIATGHEHTYERTKTLSDIRHQIVDPQWPDPNKLMVSKGSTFVFVSGLGGKEIRKQERCLPKNYPYGCHHEWAKIYTTHQGAQYGALFITFYIDGDPRKAYGYFKTIDGKIIDRFTIRTAV